MHDAHAKEKMVLDSIHLGDIVSFLCTCMNDAHAKEKTVLDTMHLWALASASFWMTPFRSGMPCRRL